MQNSGGLQEPYTVSSNVCAVRNGTDKRRWWANPDFGSELWLLRQAGKVDGTTAGKVRAMVLECTVRAAKK